MSEMERALVQLGRELEVPPAPDLAASVLARIEPQRAAPAPRRPRRWVLAVAAAVLAALVATMAIPDARSALLRILHIGGVQIEFVDALPRATPVRAAAVEPTLGTRITLEQARRDAGFDLRELEEPPDRVYLGDRGTVWFLYGSPGGVRLLVAQTPFHSVDESLFLKKLATPETRVEEVDVDGTRGFLLTGEPHFVLLLGPAGDVVEETARLARDVLVWERDGIAYRLEGDFSRDEALDLARSLR